jgi:hypothetical protein
MTPDRLDTIQEPPSVEADRLPQLFTRGIAGAGRVTREVKDVFVSGWALNFDYAEAATALPSTKTDRCVRARKFEEPLRILENLHAAWVPARGLVSERRS